MHYIHQAQRTRFNIGYNHTNVPAQHANITFNVNLISHIHTNATELMAQIEK